MTGSAHGLLELEAVRDAGLARPAPDVDLAALRARGGLHLDAEGLYVARSGAREPLARPREGDGSETIAPEDKPRFHEVRDLAGKTLEDLQGSPLLEVFEKNYSVEPHLERLPNRSKDFPRLTLDESGVLRFVPDDHPRDLVALPENALTNLASFERYLRKTSEPFDAWYRAVVREAGPEQAQRVLRTLHEGAAVGDAVGDLRYAFFKSTRGAVLDAICRGPDPKAWRARYDALVRGSSGDPALGGAHIGRLGELFYGRLRQAQGAHELVPHPALVTPPGKPKRYPDFADLETKELIEVKATARGLTPAEREQIEASLQAAAAQGGARVRVGGEELRFDKVRLAFLDKKGALGSVDQLFRWLKKNRKFTLEVIDGSGRSWTLTGQQFRSSGMNDSDLRRALSKL